MPKLSQKAEAEIVSDYLSGKPLPAKGVSTIYRVLARNGIARERRTAEKLDTKQLVEGYKAGFDVRGLASSSATVYKVLRRKGIELRGAIPREPLERGRWPFTEEAHRNPLIQAVLKLLPDNLPPHVRDEVAQDISLDLLSGVQPDLKKHLRNYFNSYEDIRNLPLDAPIPGTDLVISDILVGSDPRQEDWYNG